MFRKDLLTLLLDNPMTLSALARKLECSPREVDEDLRHLLKSIEHTEHEAVVQPAVCLKCRFQFDESKLRKPGKCPNCKSSWIRPAEISFEKRE